MAASVPTFAEFLRVYPEFTGADQTLVQAKLDLATARTDATAWGESRSEGIMLRTADLLAKSPEGRRMRLMNKDGTSIYSGDLATMVRTASIGRGRVT